LVSNADEAWNSLDVGLAGRSEVESKYDWNKIVPIIEEFYKL